ncbi:MAG: hypothetical protein SFV32_04325 [Opitutaceae bacterium]|nr:hypothetical protein [Opitutaceae bacterium]
MSTETKYTRLVRAPVSLFMRFSLWDGGDHLLQVRSSGFNEEYQRFNYSDIRALLITESSRRLIFNVIWGGLAAVFFVIAGTIGITDPSSFVLLFFTTIGAVVALWNTFLGPTCHLHLVTRVQTQRLHAIVRRRRANKLIAQLTPVIGAAQASLANAVLEPGAGPDQPLPPPLPEATG